MRRSKAARIEVKRDTHKEDCIFEVEIKEEVESEDDEIPTQTESISELLPGPKGQPMYYDGAGYYYNQISEEDNIRWLQCAHSDCGVQARMALYEGAPISLLENNTFHSHLPNPSRRERILFLHSLKTRNANEDTSFTTIFHEEAKKNPVGASFFSLDKIEQHLKKKINKNETVLEKRGTSQMPSLKSRGQPSPASSPAAKRRKMDYNLSGPEKVAKKLELLKSLQDSPAIDAHELEQPSERLQGPYPHSFIYHDGRGFYYKALSISGNTRYLKCTTPACPARAAMKLEDNAAISLESQSAPHSHPPQPKSIQEQEAREKNLPVIADTNKGNESPKATARKRTGSTRKVVTKSPTKSNLNKTTYEDNNISENETTYIVESSDEEVSVVKNSERLQGPEFFHDFKGHYYYSAAVENGRRFLRCLAPTCMARAIMTLEDNAEICTVGRTHNHPPDETTDHASKLQQWEAQWGECVPSERLPSLRLQYCCYHDGRGYYYYQTTQVDNIRYLMCAEPTCPVRAHMCTQKDAPITVSGLRPTHNHKPDPTLRDALLFVDAVRVRARSDSLPHFAIAQELTRNEIGADRVDLDLLQLCLEKAAEIRDVGSQVIAEDEVDFWSCVKPLSEDPDQPVSIQQSVANHFTTPCFIFDQLQEKLLKPKVPRRANEKSLPRPKSERVPALLTNKWLFHDGRGFYYASKGVHLDRRYMQCIQPKCSVRGWVPVDSTDAPIKISKLHTHDPQPPQYRTELLFFHKIKTRALEENDTTLPEIYREEAEKDPEGAALISEEEAMKLMKELVFSETSDEDRDFNPRSHNAAVEKHKVNITSPLPSEKIPSTKFRGGWHYHDGQGYYYTGNKLLEKTEKRYLRCIYLRSCSGRAVMGVEEGAHITMTIAHNHEPDLQHREICLFAYSVKKRVQEEETPLKTIIEEESEKFPEAKGSLFINKIKGGMVKLRQFVKRSVDIPVEGEQIEIENGDFNIQ